MNLVKKNPKDRLYQLSLPIVGLTGGIGSGKSSVAKILEENGLTVISADELVKSIYKKPIAITFVKENFPEAIQNGEINFKILREIAFTNQNHRQSLEQMIYPQMESELKSLINRRPTTPDLIIYDVPLLFERGLDSKVDLSVVVFVPKEMQIERLIKRDSIKPELAEKIISQQWPIEKKKTLAHYVINNQGTSEDLVTEVRKFIAWINS